MLQIQQPSLSSAWAFCCRVHRHQRTPDSAAHQNYFHRYRRRVAVASLKSWRLRRAAPPRAAGPLPPAQRPAAAARRRSRLPAVSSRGGSRRRRWKGVLCGPSPGGCHIHLFADDAVATTSAAHPSCAAPVGATLPRPPPPKHRRVACLQPVHHCQQSPGWFRLQPPRASQPQQTCRRCPHHRHHTGPA